MNTTREYDENYQKYCSSFSNYQQAKNDWKIEFGIPQFQKRSPNEQEIDKKYQGKVPVPINGDGFCTSRSLLLAFILSYKDNDLDLFIKNLENQIDYFTRNLNKQFYDNEDSKVTEARDLLINACSNNKAEMLNFLNSLKDKSDAEKIRAVTDFNSQFNLFKPLFMLLQDQQLSQYLHDDFATACLAAVPDKSEPGVDDYINEVLKQETRNTFPTESCCVLFNNLSAKNLRIKTFPSSNLSTISFGENSPAVSTVNGHSNIYIPNKMYEGIRTEYQEYQNQEYQEVLNQLPENSVVKSRDKVEILDEGDFEYTEKVDEDWVVIDVVRKKHSVFTNEVDKNDQNQNNKNN